MENKYTKKQLEELYNCEIFKDTESGDTGYQMWVAYGKSIDDQDEKFKLFSYASGFTLDELHNEIRECIVNEALFDAWR